MGTVLAILAKSAGSFFLKLLTATASEAFLRWLFFYVGRAVVKSTKTDHDDAFLDNIEKAYDVYEKGSATK